jgi:hypothetical protein
MIFARKGIALCSLKLRIYVPKYLWLISQLYKRSEPLKYAAAERSKNGVVGSNGTKIPIMPKTRHTVPLIIKKTFKMEEPLPDPPFDFSLLIPVESQILSFERIVLTTSKPI